VMNFGVVADVSETATSWSNLLPLYNKAREATLKAIAETGSKGWCGCHVSHSYHSGASLYFTFAWLNKAGEELPKYLHIKQAIEETFVQNGGCLSHHHAVGYEHQTWLAQDISAQSVQIIRAIKNEVDPQQIMNPGKIIAVLNSYYPKGPNTDQHVAEVDTN